MSTLRSQFCALLTSLGILEHCECAEFSDVYATTHMPPTILSKTCVVQCVGTTNMFCLGPRVTNLQCIMDQGTMSNFIWLISARARSILSAETTRR